MLNAKKQRKSNVKLRGSKNNIEYNIIEQADLVINIVDGSLKGGVSADIFWKFWVD